MKPAARAAGEPLGQQQQMPRATGTDVHQAGLDHVLGVLRDRFGDRFTAAFAMREQHSHGEGLPLEHGDALPLMRAIKQALDPLGIKNPGKMLPG